MEDPTLFDTQAFTSGTREPPKFKNEIPLCYHSWRLEFDNSNQLVSKCRYCMTDRPVDPQRDRAELEELDKMFTNRINDLHQKLNAPVDEEKKDFIRSLLPDYEEKLPQVKKWLEPSPSNPSSNPETLDEPKAIDRLIQEAEHWKQEEIEDAIAALSGLLDVKQELTGKGKGSIEEKMISKTNSKGQRVTFGPYRYLRYYNNGKKKSKYLGKKG